MIQHLLNNSGDRNKVATLKVEGNHTGQRRVTYSESDVAKFIGDPNIPDALRSDWLKSPKNSVGDGSALLPILLCLLPRLRAVYISDSWPLAQDAVLAMLGLAISRDAPPSAFPAFESPEKVVFADLNAWKRTGRHDE